MTNLKEKIKELTDEIEKDERISLMLLALDHGNKQSMVHCSINNPNQDYCCDLQVFAMLSEAILTYGNDANHYCCAECFFKEFVSFMDELVFEDEDSVESMGDQESQILLN